LSQSNLSKAWRLIQIYITNWHNAEYSILKTFYFSGVLLLINVPACHVVDFQTTRHKNMKHETKDDLQLVRGITVIVTVALSFTKHESMKLLHLTAQLYVVLVGNPTAADNLSL